MSDAIPTIAEAARLIAKKELSPVELTAPASTASMRSMTSCMPLSS